MSVDNDQARREHSKQVFREKKAQRKATLEADPRYQAAKEARKERMRAAYAQLKERRRALATERKKQRKEKKAAERAERDAALMKLVRPAADRER